MGELAVRDGIICEVISLGSCGNAVKQFEAIKSINTLKPHLQAAIYTSNFTEKVVLTPILTKENIPKPRSVPTGIWNSLKKSCNTYQLSAISDVLSGKCKNNVGLIKGPPGCGKSSTIVGLVSALISGKPPLPGQRQFGCLIQSAAISQSQPSAQRRILVLAVTNAAADTIAYLIWKGSIGHTGKTGEFQIARFGSLPWERGSGHKQPVKLSPFEKFLDDINVDRQAQRGMRRSQILQSALVVVTTLSSSGSKTFINAVNDSKNQEFDAVVIDECCQASEPETLIPFKFNPTTVTLVGDPEQLPVLTLSNKSSKKVLENSMFQRLASLNFPLYLLQEQYRMHESIASFPSKHFYNSKLITSNRVRSRVSPPWYVHSNLPPLCFWDTGSRTMREDSFTNYYEADFITGTLLPALTSTLVQKHSKRKITVGIISFYRNQVSFFGVLW